MQYLKYLVLPIVLGIFIISCEKDDSTIVDPILNIPRISDQTFTPLTFDSDTINAVATVKVESVDPIKQVSVTLINPNNEGEGAFQLKDDGVSPDITAGDGIYSGRVVYTRTCRFVGDWKAEFIAETDAGLFSNTNQVNFSVINSNNQKPVVTEIYLPDSLQRPTGVGGDTMRSAFLKVNVVDPNGSCDILSPGAYFNAVNPNGIPNPNNPFSMYDNGVLTPPYCDTIANDGKYSLLIYITTSATLGNYTFKFNSKDRSLFVSDTLIHFINVYQ